MEKVISFLLFCFLVLFPFGQLTRLPLRIEEVNIYLIDIILGLLLTFWAIWLFLKKVKFQKPPLAKPIFLFLFLAFVSLVFNTPRLASREIVIAGLYWLRLTAYFGLYFLIFNFKKHFNYLNRQFLLNCLLIVGVAMSIFGLIQYLFLPDMTLLQIFEWDPHYYRVVGTFLDPGFSGIIYVLTLILLVVLNWKKKNGIFYLLWLVVYSALALTYSRSSYLAYLIAMGAIAFFKKTPKFFLAVFSILLLTLIFLPRWSGGEGIRLERTSTIQARIKNWKQALIISRDHPILGVGFNAYRYAQRDYGFLDEKWQFSHAGAGADSSFLFVLATTGILGFLAYSYFWWRVIFTSGKNDLGLIVLASVAVLLVHSCFLNSLFYPWILTWLMIILALP